MSTNGQIIESPKNPTKALLARLIAFYQSSIAKVKNARQRGCKCVLRAYCRQVLTPVQPLLFAFRDRKFCQSFDLLVQRCRCQRFAPHDFEHIQTVIDLFQSLFHRLQIAL